MIIAYWNVSWLNEAPRQKEVKRLVIVNRLDVFALLETYVQEASRVSLANYLMPGWRMVRNNEYLVRRVWICYNPGVTKVQVISKSDQVIHVMV